MNDRPYQTIEILDGSDDTNTRVLRINVPLKFLLRFPSGRTYKFSQEGQPHKEQPKE